MTALRRWRMIMLPTVIGIAALTAAWYAAHIGTLRRGDALFHGQVTLHGRITGQTEPLPTSASRCINCHVASQGTATPGFAPSLDKTFLTGSHSRRGGPASRYDQRAFCALLRTSIDPAYVMVPQEMPRYDISDDDCGALWLYSVSR